MSISSLDPAAERLRDSLRGELVTPADPAYEEARRIWNRMIDRRPALIARVVDVDDTRHALAYALEHELPISIRGGGHNVAGTALVDGGVVIDNSARRAVHIDPVTRRVEVEPGVTLGELDAALAPHGLAVPAGIQTTTGVAGLSLGGGIGWLMRRDGLTCDHLVAADLLTAGGDVVRVSADDNPDLLWALRGGGGNFGIATRFVFDAVPLDPVAFAGLVAFPMDEGESVLRAYREWAAGLPREATTIVALRSILPLPAFPAELHGRQVVLIALCHTGPHQADEELHHALRSMGNPLIDTLARKPFVAHQALFDAAVPAGLGYYWKSHFVDGLTDGLVETLLDHNRRAPTTWSYTLLFQLGGAIADVAPDATAYTARSAGYAVNINGVALVPTEDEAITAWTRDCFDATVPHSTGGVYVNFMGEEGEQRVRAAYGPAYDRLAAVKARWDPENVFRANQNIRPAPG